MKKRCCAPQRCWNAPRISPIAQGPLPAEAAGFAPIADIGGAFEAAKPRHVLEVEVMAQARHDGIGILKSIWKKTEAGAWAVHDLQSIDLNPRDGFGKDYFKIKSEVNLLTHSPGPIFENLFSTFSTTEFLVKQSIVSVVAWNEGDKKMRCIGTGF